MLRIGNLNLDLPFFQAPLSGYSERPMRILARRFGAPLTFAGVMLDKISLHPKAVKKLRFQPGEDEHPIGAQILGSDPKSMAASAAAFQKLGYDVIDLNFACPAPKVLRRNRGGFLLTKPNLLIEIFKRVRDAVTCPVMIKLRTGFDYSDAAQEDFWRICELLSQHSVDALTIHGRTVLQKYRKSADWQTVAEVKSNFPNLTIIGSGDILNANAAIHRLKSSGVDGILIARGAIGNPWIFKDLTAMYQNRPLPLPPQLAEQGRIMLEHFEMTLQIREISKAVRYFRKFAAAYAKRHPDRKKVQMALLSAKTKNQVFDTIKAYYPIS